MSKRDVWELTREMFLSESEVEAIRASIALRLRIAELPALWQARTDQLIFEVLTFSGLRNSELCHLRVSDVPPELGEPGLRIAESPRQNRLVAIPRDLVRLIENYVSDVRPHRLHESMSVRDLNLPLLVNDRGKPFDRTTLYRRVVKVLSAAGFEDRASVQLLRHTYGYLAYKRTQGNLLFVQQQLGHSHPIVTAVYAEFVDFSKVELANLVAGPPTPKRVSNTATAVAKPSRKKGASS